MKNWILKLSLCLIAALLFFSAFAVAGCNNDDKVTITVTANDSVYGTVSGGGSFDKGASVSVTATANTNFKFINWSQDGNSVSTDSTYTFTADTNRTLTANFEVDLSGPGIDEISYYTLPDSFWVQLSFSDGTVSNFVRFGNDYYCDSVRNRIQISKKCLIGNPDGSYSSYNNRLDDNDEFVWVKTQDEISGEAAGKAAHSFFLLILPAFNEEPVALESLSIGDDEIVCDKYSVPSGFGSSDYWMPQGYDFWIKCNTFDQIGNEININSTLVKLHLEGWPDWIDLPLAV